MTYDFSNLNFLVIEDNRHMTVLVFSILHGFGARKIHKASSAEEAWDLFDYYAMDFILVDWVLPGMSGLDFTRQVRTSKDSRNPFIPILIMTAHSTGDHVRDARNAGANDFLTKPLSPRALYARLASIIEQPRPFVRVKDYFGPCRRRRKIADYGTTERRANMSPI